MPDMDTGQERARIDRGLTQEKIGASDPAAAPMETDSESGGAAMPATGQRLAPPRQMMEAAWRTPRPETFGAWRKPGRYEGRVGRLGLAWGSVLVALGIALGVWGLT